MRFSCPSCSTEYEVPDAALAGRSRKLRCARCGHEWRIGEPEQSGPKARLAPDAHTHSWSPLAQEQKPEQNAEPEDPPRRFGQPVDEAAEAEIIQAVEAEEKSSLAENAPEFDDSLPEFLTARGQGSATPLETSDADQDKFASLIRAARNKSLEYEPEPRRLAPSINTSSPLFLGGLALVLVILCVLLFEHRHIF